MFVFTKTHIMTILKEDGVILINPNTTEVNTVDKQMYMYAVKIVNFHDMASKTLFRNNPGDNNDNDDYVV